MGLDVVAAHLHHGQRPEADTEQNLCEAFANELDVPFITGRADIPRMARELGIGFEEAGREARYSFFRQAAFGTESHLIATAHTRTDQVETILLNLSRGCGLHGLAGIPEQRDQIIRPLLPFSREETRAYCEERGFWFHDDPANEDLSFSRARVRHRVLPELRAINPGADAALVRLAATALEEDRFLNGMAAAALEQSEVPLNGDLKFLTEDAEIRFGRDRLSSLPPTLFKRAVRLAVEALGAGLDYEQTLLIANGIATEERGSVTAEGGEVVAEWDPEHFEVRQLRPAEPFRYSLTVPGETESDTFGWRFIAFEEESYEGPTPPRATLDVRLSRRALKGTPYFRTVQPGDTMTPLGFDGHRKLASLLSEARLTEAARRRLPIVCDFLGPVWAPGVCVDERVRPVAGEPVLRIQFGKLET
jgi:tRNA(Ile)-lysidine synthase